ncbi:hypothetical protein A0J48_003785 [Sphaerospermopsis aphanizomenoides BCCUSP55]|uniref:hypothetical protein n=1 Tax=Sphaerospermopsis aphanizomenoides TaxID=459663 RepID=UPI001906F721|nr:hypothetical protein [Sphaerospermopsis aphanizomenoides]MBK1986669.1 hypothetical protein [Sphaerospermopsis aphanizomenoides BCCUSP55]
MFLLGFSQGIDFFAEETKAEIQYQIDQIAESQSTKSSTTQKVKAHRSPVMKTSQSIDWWGNFGDIVADVGGGILELFSKGLGSVFRAGVKGGTSLLQSLSKEIPQVFDSANEDMGEIPKISDPYIIRVRSKTEADKISRIINKSCASLIQKFWVDTQDTLVRDGTNIREKLALKIENDIQEISNELSDYLGKELQVKLNINKIQFPKFEFPGIDARIKQQQEIFKRTKQEERTEKNCCSSKTYYVPVDYEERQDFYEVDLRQTTELIYQKIDEPV